MSPASQPHQPHPASPTASQERRRCRRRTDRTVCSVPCAPPREHGAQQPLGSTLSGQCPTAMLPTVCFRPRTPGPAAPRAVRPWEPNPASVRAYGLQSLSRGFPTMPSSGGQERAAARSRPSFSLAEDRSGSHCSPSLPLSGNTLQRDRHASCSRFWARFSHNPQPNR